MPKHIDIVFDGPPGHDAGRFVEVEDENLHSIRFGEWIKRDDGYWVLRFYPSAPSYTASDADSPLVVDGLTDVPQWTREDLELMKSSDRPYTGIRINRII